MFNRRDLLKFLGGSAVGTLLTPIPWKTLDDVAIWTQNWSWIPVPARGEKCLRYTNCTLCPAGCGLQALCVGDQPVALAGVTTHPASRGFVCPAGLTAHQLPYDPARLKAPVHQARKNGSRQPVATHIEHVLQETSNLLADIRTRSDGLVAILDTCPGRSTSLAYQSFATRIPNARYLSVADPAGEGLRVIGRLAGWPGDEAEAGVDLEKARTILSFGAGLHEGWGTPGRVFSLLRSGAKKARLIQVETRQSTTALAADRWLPVKPGTEAALALGLAWVIVDQKLYDESGTGVSALLADSSWRASLVEFPPSRVASITGLSEETLISTAKEMTADAPCLVISGRDHTVGPLAQPEQVAIQALNLLLGNVGCEGGIVPRRPLPAPAALTGEKRQAEELASLPDGSIRLLLIDAATARRPAIRPGDLLRKLHRDSSVVCLSPSRDGYARLADYVLPTPGFLECLEEIPTTPDLPVASLSLSLPLIPAPAGTIGPLDFLNRLAEKSGVIWPVLNGGELLDSRIEAIWEAKRGSVFTPSDGNSKEIDEFLSPLELAQALRDGGCWQDSRIRDGSKAVRAENVNADAWDSLKLIPRQETATTTFDYPLLLVPFATPFMAAPAPLLTTKLTKESGLYPDSGEALLNPSTAATFGLRARQRVKVETARGSFEGRIRTDDGVMPGIVFVPVFSFASRSNSTCLLEEADEAVSTAVRSVLPEVRDICTSSEDGIWHPTPARVRRLDV